MYVLRSFLLVVVLFAIKKSLSPQEHNATILFLFETQLKLLSVSNACSLHLLGVSNVCSLHLLGVSNVCSLYLFVFVVTHGFKLSWLQARHKVLSTIFTLIAEVR